jgi:hypothetical protein
LKYNFSHVHMPIHMYILLDRGMNLILETILYGVQTVTRAGITV